MCCCYVCEGIAVRIRRCHVISVHRYAHQVVIRIRAVGNRLIRTVIHCCIRCDCSVCYGCINRICVDRVNHRDRMIGRNTAEGVTARMDQCNVDSIHLNAHQVVSKTRAVVDCIAAAVIFCGIRRNRSACDCCINQIIVDRVDYRNVMSRCYVCEGIAARVG